VEDEGDLRSLLLAGGAALEQVLRADELVVAGPRRVAVRVACRVGGGELEPVVRGEDLAVEREVAILPAPLKDVERVPRRVGHRRDLDHARLVRDQRPERIPAAGEGEGERGGGEQDERAGATSG